MRTRIEKRQRQVVSEEVQRSLLELIQRKFFDGRAVDFAKARKDILKWVIYWPAREWFNPKSLTIPNARYLEILTKIIMDAATFQRGKIHYVPRWLGKAVTSHFANQGEGYYAEAKSARSLADHALATLGKLTAREDDDVVGRFTQASQLLEASKVVVKRSLKTPPKRAVNDQLTFL